MKLLYFTMASLSTTETVQPVVAATAEQPKVAKPRRLEIETGDGLFFLFVCGAQGVGKTALITRVSHLRPSPSKHSRLMSMDLFMV